MLYSCVLFDLDGTLADSIELILQSAEAAFTACGYPVPPRAEITSGIGRPLATQLGAYTSDAAELARLIKAYRTFQIANHDSLTTPYDGVTELVHTLRDQGRQLAVVTSKAEPLAKRALTRVGLDDCFSLIVGLEATQKHKPEPDPLLHAMERLGAPPRETVYVGDSPYDVMAAHAAAISSVAVGWGAFTLERLASEKPTHMVSSSSELAQILLGTASSTTRTQPLTTTSVPPALSE